ncbi:MAG: hypothetical protein GY810_13055 [Aureispira sp.]|nr:hypothetical protein [Aureispira sp.]
MEKELPLVITKAWLAKRFERPFRWLRKHLLTDKVITDELGFNLNQFKKWTDIPPIESQQLKKWLIEKELI